MRVAAVRGFQESVRDGSLGDYGVVRLAVHNVAQWLGMTTVDYCRALKQEGPFIWDRVPQAERQRLARGGKV